jgi:hypothetical protein
MTDSQVKELDISLVEELKEIHFSVQKQIIDQKEVTQDRLTSPLQAQRLSIS